MCIYILQKDIYKIIHGSIVHNCPKLETVQMTKSRVNYDNQIHWLSNQISFACGTGRAQLE